MTIWMNGSLTNDEQAQISVLDHGLLYGDGIFEGIRATSGYVVDLDLHLARLERSARAMWLSIPSAPELRKIVLDTLQAHAQPNAYIRLVITRGVGQLGIDTSGCTPNVICIAGTIAVVPEQSKLRGISLITSSYRRPNSDVLDPSVKSLNYANSVLAKLEAKRQGADEALVLNQRGLVAEASAANIFVLRDRELITPPSSDGCLPGITRQRVLGLAHHLGLQPREQSLSRYDVLSADEVLLTGTGAGLLRVRCLDGQSIGTQSSNDETVSGLVARLSPLLERYARKHGVPIASMAPVP